MRPANPVAFAKWRNDIRTGVAQESILAARDKAREARQFANTRNGFRLRLLVDDLAGTYQIAHLRKWPPLIDPESPKPLTPKEFREFALAMLGGRLHQSPHHGWLLDLAETPA